MSDKHNLEIYENAKELAWAAALRFASFAEQSIKAYGRFTVALSGGSTPKALFTILAEKPFADSLPWQNIYLFWGDERCVPPDHADSNFRMTNEALLAKAPVPAENVFRVPGEDEDHERAAANYAAAIQQFFGSDAPQFDLVFLGMGADGHTASLVPNDAVLEVHDHEVALTGVYMGRRRMTLTYPVLNHARNILWLATGAEKTAMLRRLRDGDESIPAGRVRRENAIVLADAAAAANL